jgi:ABC-type transporter Mla MlaB component
MISLAGPVERPQDVCMHVCALLERSDSCLLVCDVRFARADAATVDALARVELAARRHGCRLRLRRPQRELRELIDLMGLADLLRE